MMHILSCNTCLPCLQLLSLEFCYLLLTTLASTWFGISVFYTILDQLIQVTFNESEVLRQVSKGASMSPRAALSHLHFESFEFCMPAFMQGKSAIVRWITRFYYQFLCCFVPVADRQHPLAHVPLPHHSPTYSQPQK
jgi:hypothetical protein